MEIIKSNNLNMAVTQLLIGRFYTLVTHLMYMYIKKTVHIKKGRQTKIPKRPKSWNFSNFFWQRHTIYDLLHIRVIKVSTMLYFPICRYKLRNKKVWKHLTGMNMKLPSNIGEASNEFNATQIRATMEQLITHLRINVMSIYSERLQFSRMLEQKPYKGKLFMCYSFLIEYNDFLHFKTQSIRCLHWWVPTRVIKWKPLITINKQITLTIISYELWEIVLAYASNSQITTCSSVWHTLWFKELTDKLTKKNNMNKRSKRNMFMLYVSQ